MRHMITSQMSLTKLNMKMLMVKFDKLQHPVTNLVLDLIKPFQQMLEEKRLEVSVVEINKIPSWANTDWDIFSQILFHLVQNAIKFNIAGGSIKIMLSFHTFEDEFGKDPSASHFEEAKNWADHD